MGDTTVTMTASGFERLVRRIEKLESVERAARLHLAWYDGDGDEVLDKAIQSCDESIEPLRAALVKLDAPTSDNGIIVRRSERDPGIDRLRTLDLLGMP